MQSDVKRLSVALLAGAMILALAGPAPAQFIPTNGSLAYNRFVARQLQQNINVGTMLNNAPYARTAPFFNGPVTPFFGPGVSPFVPSGIPPIYPTLTSNPYAASAYNPYTASLSSTGYPSSDYGASGYNPYMSYADPYGGYMRGLADVTTAQANYHVKYQQARLIREDVTAKQIQNRRSIFDEFNYERMNTPSAEELRRKELQTALERARFLPNSSEINSATTLNTLLSHLVAAQGKGNRGSTVPLDEDLIKKINVSARAGGNIGVLKNDGNLTWPLALRGEAFEAERKDLDRFAPEAIKQAQFNTRVDTAYLNDMTEAQRKLHRKLESKVSELSPGQYMEAKKFLNNIDDAIRALQDPNVANYFSGKYAAKARTVAELIDYMAKQGLSFAPAVSGDEAAYHALYNALLAYDGSMNANRDTEKK
jgi:hypothetical protein